MRQGLRSIGLMCAFVSASMLAGCGRVGERVAGFYYEAAKPSSPAVVISPGYKVLLVKHEQSIKAPVEGETVLISGFDECPKQDRVMEFLFGPSPDEGRNDCIVLDKARSSIPVQVAYVHAQRVAVEQWKIHREETATGERTSLVPPSGDLVLEAPRHS